jgi:hypothetical protein
MFAAAAGIMALWFGSTLAGGRRDAWASPIDWPLARQLVVLAAAVVGRLWPQRPGRVVLAMFAEQFVAMMIRNGEFGGLWALGLALFGLLSLPAIVVAFAVAGFLRRRRGPRRC